MGRGLIAFLYMTAKYGSNVLELRFTEFDEDLEALI